jgi:hypothetical protein
MRQLFFFFFFTISNTDESTPVDRMNNEHEQKEMREPKKDKNRLSYSQSKMNPRASLRIEGAG